MGIVMRDFVPWRHIMNYIEAVFRVYNQFGRRDNKYKARMKILAKAEGQRFIGEVEEEFRQIVECDGAPHTIPQAEFDHVSACFDVPPQAASGRGASPEAARALEQAAEQTPQFQRWLERNVAPHKDLSLRIVTLSFKRLLQTPGDASADQAERVADLVGHYSAGEARVTHTQNIVLTVQ